MRRSEPVGIGDVIKLPCDQCGEERLISYLVQEEYEAGGAVPPIRLACSDACRDALVNAGA